MAKKNLDRVVTCKVHPAIGIARVGNSPREHFIGPELPGDAEPPPGGYKDAGDLNRGIPPRVKRQGARFRVFGYDDEGVVVGELTATDARITWNVHLANNKAEWDTFDGLAGAQLPLGGRRPETAWRNADLRGDDRKRMLIDGGAHELKGPDQRVVFDQGRIFDVAVPLGEAFTDADARLVVLGGFGKSGMWEPGHPITHYANNDRWYDDVADGPVRAHVEIGGRVVPAAPAWVVVAPPDFAPAVGNIVTLFDVISEVAVELGARRSDEMPSFKHDVFPILRRTNAYAWVHPGARKFHRPGSGGAGDFMSRLAVLAENGHANRGAREAVFARLRDPNATGDAASAQANARYMPDLSGDEGTAQENRTSTWLSLTRNQYRIMHQWMSGDFVPDWDGKPPAPPDPTPANYDRGPLEHCSGGAFYPGMEVSWLVRNKEAYAEPFRLNADRLAPGDVSKQMAVPWQADFFECRENWWPAQRPDDVMTLPTYERLKQIDNLLAALGASSEDEAVRATLVTERTSLYLKREAWTRSFPPGADVEPGGDREMVRSWSRLGFVVARQDGEPFRLADGDVLVETHVTPYNGLTEAESFHHLINIDRFPDFLPKARELAASYLAQADYNAAPFFAPFEYTPDAFTRRMTNIYEIYVTGMDDPYQAIADGRSRAAIIEGLRQRAPMNLVDGAWLQRAMPTGPCDEVRARLFAIWADEAGNGRPEWNHCNVYDALLRELNIFLPPLRSRAFVELDFLPSAFTNPCFQLAVGLFPEEFFPELLGMTLYLEWEATPTLTPTARGLKSLGINPLFYQLHIAIDNIASGHGALAKQAIELFLARKEEEGGPRLVQELWSRIWNGYVTWATIGTFSGDLAAHLKRFDRDVTPEARKALARERMIALVRTKAPHARTAHGARMMTVAGQTRPLNDLFNEPELLLAALEDYGWIDKQYPRQSRFFTELLAFSGRMYKVFTPEDEAIMIEWIESLEDGPATPPADIGTRAAAVLERYKARAAANPRHDGITLPQSDGTTRTLRTWATGPIEDWMAALARSEYIVTGRPDQSRLFTDVFVTRMPGRISGPDLMTLRRWVTDGCPLPAPATPAVAVALDASDGRRTMARRRKAIGAGSVH